MIQSLQIVLVLYKTTLSESLSYQSLKENIVKTDIDYELIIYNNSPDIQIEPGLDFVLVNSAGNNMLAGAYNYALQRATESKKEWLLLLDQDTVLTEEYFREIELFLNNPRNSDITAAVPILYKGDIQLSPITYQAKLGLFMYFHPINSGEVIKHNHCISAFNSAAVVNVKFMNSIGGFSKDYPLDMLDHWYFYKMYKARKSIYLMNSRLEQNLSLMETKKMSLERYRIYMNALTLFAREFHRLSAFFLKLLLAMILFRQFITPDDRRFIRMTLKALLGMKL